MTYVRPCSSNLRHKIALACLSLLFVAEPVKAHVLELTADGTLFVYDSLETKAAALPQAGNIRRRVVTLYPEQPLKNTQQYRSQAQERLQQPPQAVQQGLQAAGNYYAVSQALLEAVAWQESRFRQEAKSPVGAQGVMQLMPGTARDLGVDPRDKMQNIYGGAAYLRAMLNRFNGNLELALAAYNAGPARVERAGGVPDIPETKAYVQQILERLAQKTQQLPSKN
jgi:soluble lytic murein transglycosylase-like protein